MTRPIDPAHDLVALLVTLTRAEAAGAADRLRSIAELPAPDLPSLRARDRLVAWAEVLDTAR